MFQSLLLKAFYPSKDEPVLMLLLPTFAFVLIGLITNLTSLNFDPLHGILCGYITHLKRDYIINALEPTLIKYFSIQDIKPDNAFSED